MLAVTRRLLTEWNERQHAGEDSIVLTLPDGRRVVVRVRGTESRNAVKVVVDAPADVHILRAELEGGG